MKIAHLKIATVYAQTLFQESTQRKTIEAVLSNVQELTIALQKNEEFLFFFQNKLIKAQQKIIVLQALQKKMKWTPTMQSFLELLCTKRREYVIQEIVEQFVHLYYVSKHILVVNVTSATALSANSIKQIEKKIKTILNAKEIILKTSHNEALIGGLKIEFDNKILDLSIQYSLQQLQQQLLAN